MLMLYCFGEYHLNSIVVVNVRLASRELTDQVMERLDASWLSDLLSELNMVAIMPKFINELQVSTLVCQMMCYIWV